MQITNGMVSYTRSVKPADYEKKEATVQLSFAVDEGEDFVSAIEAVGIVAKDKALQMVGLKTASETAAAATVAKEGAAATLNAADEKIKRGRPAKPPAEHKKPEPPATDPAAMDEVAEVKKPEPPKDDPAAMSDDTILGAESQPPVTDKELIEAITKKCHLLQPKHGSEAAPMIRKLIVKYAGPIPKQSRDMPPSVRRAFLAEVEALS